MNLPPDIITQLGASLNDEGIVEHYGAPAEEVTALASGPGFALQHHRDRLRAHGKDVRSFLNRLLTYDFMSLSVGGSCRPFLLDAKGKIQLAFYAAMTDECHLLMDATAGHGEAIIERLDMFHFGEDFHLENIPDEMGLLTILGHDVERCVSSLFGISLESPWQNAPAPFDLDGTQIAEARIWISRVQRFGEECVDLWHRTDDSEHLINHLLAAGIKPVGQHACEVRRIERCIPAHPAEFSEHATPLDADGFDGLTDGKGCYPGQEVIERTIALGRPAYRLVGLSADDAPTADTLHVEGKIVGRITSGVSLSGNNWVGLGLVKQRYAALQAWDADGCVVRARVGGSHP